MSGSDSDSEFYALVETLKEESLKGAYIYTRTKAEYEDKNAQNWSPEAGLIREKFDLIIDKFRETHTLCQTMDPSNGNHYTDLILEEVDKNRNLLKAEIETVLRLIKAEKGLA